jgi:sterol desaturase/sphingolipid hydroxylase (fatty acid hydroxylase superfamily)
MASVVIIVGYIALALILIGSEWIFPLRHRGRSFVPRLAVNLVLSAMAFLLASFLVRPAALATAGWASTRPFGLLALVELPPLANTICGLLLMDLAFYYWHRLNHCISILWRFHNVHHIDPDLDITTAVRFHFGEIILSTCFRVIQVAVIGVSGSTYFIYEIVFQANTLFQHSNIRLPIAVERVVNKILVTPRMHGIHHSAVMNETNSDYSVVFCWWDWMHGTLRLNVPQSRIRIGIPAYLDPDDNTLWNCLRLPFIKQREYWRFPDGSTATREPGQLEPKQVRLAE